MKSISKDGITITLSSPQPAMTQTLLYSIRTDAEADLAREMAEQGFSVEEILDAISEEREIAIQEDYDTDG